MITTIVVWPQSGAELNPTSLQREECDAYALTLEDGQPETRTSVLSEDGTSLTVTRSWSTVELAQAWVDYIMSTYNVTSAVVNVSPD